MSIQPKLPLMENATDQTEMPNRWLMVTNHLNLLYMLAAGLIMSPKEFGQNYFSDSLCSYSGWIPLFANDVPSTAINQSVCEAKHLKPCLLSVDLSHLRGNVKGIGCDNRLIDIAFPQEIKSDLITLLVPAPLPVTWIDAIIFRSLVEKKETAIDAMDFNNVPFSNFKSEVKKNFFIGRRGGAWPIEGLDLPDLDLSMSAPLAAGAMMAMIMKRANVDTVAKEVSKLVFDPEIAGPMEIADPMISCVGDWQSLGRIPKNTTHILKKLFWGAIDCLIDCKASDCHQSDLDLILGYLKVEATQLDDRYKDSLLNLCDDLKKLASLGEDTITELFERHPKPFSRVMTLFFLRENCSDLLEFQHPMLKEQDYLAAAILFAARDGWLKLPLELRDTAGLQEAVSHRMAAMAHRIAGRKLDLGPAPLRPRPLLELFEPGPQGWSKRQKEAALFLARDCKWSGIRTRITLGSGEYRVKVDGRGTHIFMEGEAKAVITEMEAEQFFANLISHTFTSEQEHKTRALLKT